MKFTTKTTTHKLRFITVFIATLLFTSNALAFNSLGFDLFISQIKHEAIARGISRETVWTAFAHVQQMHYIVVRDRAQAKPGHAVAHGFTRYLEATVTHEKITNGRSQYSQYRRLLRDVSSRYQVQPQYVVALWGLESDYGHAMGNFPVISVLASLAYDKRRSSMFHHELIDALVILDKGYAPLDYLRGSWAGAMGQCQFMPSSYLTFAVDFGGRGRPDIWHKPSDVFASTANYLRHMGWDGKGTMIYTARLPQNLDKKLLGFNVHKPLNEWRKLGINVNGYVPYSETKSAYFLLAPEGLTNPGYLVQVRNFQAIMAWNHSRLYAIAVGLLANAVSR
jgi:membrane-bound lytic murein transglycosylase B